MTDTIEMTDTIDAGDGETRPDVERATVFAHTAQHRHVARGIARKLRKKKPGLLNRLNATEQDFLLNIIEDCGEALGARRAEGRALLFDFLVRWFSAPESDVWIEKLSDRHAALMGLWLGLFRGGWFKVEDASKGLAILKRLLPEADGTEPTEEALVARVTGDAATFTALLRRVCSCPADAIRAAGEASRVIASDDVRWARPV